MSDGKINILGTEYSIQKRQYDTEPVFAKKGIDGYCDSYQKLIVYCDLDSDKRWDDEPQETKMVCEKQTLRHEVVHAFLHESGLRESSHGIECGWASDEEVVDWFAIQSPKIYKVFAELNIL